MSSQKTTNYIAMWDCDGLECIFNTTAAMTEIEAWEKAHLFAILKEEWHQPQPRPIPLNQMILRARINSQRSYEIYEFTSLVSEEDIRNAFRENPQPLVEWIRKNGCKIYSDYTPSERQKIR
jgi:hypothetical protein